MAVFKDHFVDMLRENGNTTFKILDGLRDVAVDISLRDAAKLDKAIVKTLGSLDNLLSEAQRIFDNA